MTNTEPAASDHPRREQDALHRRLQMALFGGIAALALFGIAVSALAHHDRGQETARAAARQASMAPTPAPQTVSVTVRGGDKLGPDGKRHDSWSVTSYRVRVGRPVELRIDNRDDAPHTMTAPQAGVDIVAAPGVHTYTLVVPRAGRFRWFCRVPCDDWAMAHAGYMAGSIEAT